MSAGAKRGTRLGFGVGVVALVVLYAVAGQCLPFRIASLVAGRPFFCADPLYGILAYLAFPVNLLTNDLSQAVLLAPLSLLFYAVGGGVVGYFSGRRSEG